jgi:heme-degrading monooxygenase HmoA
MERDFERFNGSGGPWAQLFARSTGYLGTELTRVSEVPAEYIVTDRWRSRAEWEAFRAAHASAYEELDRRGEAFTVWEHLVRETELSSPRGEEAQP